MGTGLFLPWELPLEIPHCHSNQSCWPAEGELALTSPDTSWKWGSVATAPYQGEIKAICFSHMTASVWQAHLSLTGPSRGLTHWWVTQGSPSDNLEPVTKAKSPERSSLENLVTAARCPCVCATGQILAGGQPLNGFRFLPGKCSHLPLAAHSFLIQEFKASSNVTCKPKATGTAP